MAGAQQMGAIDEGLMRQLGQRRQLDLEHALAGEIGGADVIRGELAIGRVVLAQREQLVKITIAHILFGPRIGKTGREKPYSAAPVKPGRFSCGTCRYSPPRRPRRIWRAIRRRARPRRPAGFPRWRRRPAGIAGRILPPGRRRTRSPRTAPPAARACPGRTASPRNGLPRPRDPRTCARARWSFPRGAWRATAPAARRLRTRS